MDSQDTAELLEIDENVEKDGENVSWQINRTFDDYFLGYRKLSKSNYSMPIQNSEGSEKKTEWKKRHIRNPYEALFIILILLKRAKTAPTKMKRIVLFQPLGSRIGLRICG